MDTALGHNLPASQNLMNLYRGLMIYEGDRAVPEQAPACRPGKRPWPAGTVATIDSGSLGGVQNQQEEVHARTA